MENTAKKVYYHLQHLYKSLDSKIVLIINCRGMTGGVKGLGVDEGGGGKEGGKDVTIAGRPTEKEI